MKKKSNKNGYAKVLKDKVDEIASNFVLCYDRDHRYQLLQRTFQMVQRMQTGNDKRYF